MSKGVATQADYERLLQLASDEAAAAKENALRQLDHLRREIDYGYPPAVLRPTRRVASRAVTAHIETMETESGRFRDLMRHFPDAGKKGVARPASPSSGTEGDRP